MSTREFQAKLRSIRNAGRGIQPDPAWVRRTRETLLVQVANTMPRHASSWREHVRQAVRSVMPARLMAQVRGPFLAVLSIVGVVAGGSIASVSAAERALPGDLLYPVKLATEQTRLILAGSKTEQVKLKTEFVERRGDEIKQIISSGVSEKPERIREATEILKRDLDTVKNQLSDATAQDSVAQVVQAAKLVDQKSSELVDTLKDVKSSVPSDIRIKVTEAEVAAVNTGVKAVQVLIDSHDNPAAQSIVSNDELVQSIQSKVQGLQQNISDAAQKLLTTSATGTAALNATSTSANIDASSSSTIALLDQVSSSSASIIELKSVQKTLDQ